MNRTPGTAERPSYLNRRNFMRAGAVATVGGLAVAFGGRIRDSIIGPKDGKLSIAERALQHVRENVQWQEIITFLKENHFICIDGRCNCCAACTPGGDVGMMFTELSAVQAITGKQFTYEQIVDALKKYRAHLHRGKFYEHTDDHAVEHMAQDLGMDIETLEHELEKPSSPRMAQRILQAMDNPMNIGCGHNRGIIKEPWKYKADSRLLGFIRRARMELAWNGEIEIETDPLKDSHLEQAFVILKARTGFHPSHFPTVRTRSQYGQFFFEHVDAEDAANAAFSATVEQVTGRSVEAVRLNTTIGRLADQYRAVSAEALVKPGTPTVVIEYGDPDEKDPFSIASVR